MTIAVLDGKAVRQDLAACLRMAAWLGMAVRVFDHLSPARPAGPWATSRPHPCRGHRVSTGMDNAGDGPALEAARGERIIDAKGKADTCS